MSTGRKLVVGLGVESTPGTGVVPVRFVPSLESFTVTKPSIESVGPWGHYDNAPMIEGRQEVGGALSEFEARPDIAGFIFYLLAGGYGVTGADPYTHTIDFIDTPIATLKPLPSVTAFTDRPGGERSYHLGGQVNGLTLNCDVNQPVKFQGVDFIFEDYSDGVADASETYEEATPFAFRHAQHERAASAFDLWESFNISFANNLQAEYLQQDDEKMAAVFLGKRDIRISGTIAYRDTDVWTQFAAHTTAAYKFRWEITNAAIEMQIDIPAGRIASVGREVASLDRLTRAVEIVAERDASAGHAAQVTIINDVADYSAL